VSLACSVLFLFELNRLLPVCWIVCSFIQIVSMAVPVAIGVTTNMNPYAGSMLLIVAAARAVAPPGGCTVPVACMTAMAEATDRAPHSHIHCCSLPLHIQWNRALYAQPTRAESTWPRKAFLGEASSALGHANRSTAAAPNDIARKGGSW
jgi:hypothetical protein